MAAASCQQVGCGSIRAGSGRRCRTPGRRPERPARRAGPGRPHGRGPAPVQMSPRSVVVELAPSARRSAAQPRSTVTRTRRPARRAARGTRRHVPEQVEPVVLVQHVRNPRNRSARSAREAPCDTPAFCVCADGRAARRTAQSGCCAEDSSTSASSSRRPRPSMIPLAPAPQRLGVDPREAPPCLVVHHGASWLVAPSRRFARASRSTCPIGPSSSRDVVFSSASVLVDQPAGGRRRQVPAIALADIGAASLTACCVRLLQRLVVGPSRSSRRSRSRSAVSPCRRARIFVGPQRSASRAGLVDHGGFRRSPSWPSRPSTSSRAPPPPLGLLGLAVARAMASSRFCRPP